MKKYDNKINFTSTDYEFMNSLSSAILEKAPSRVSLVIKIWLIIIFIFIVWASFAQIDEITRGDGKVVPYGQNKIIQNLEGGIVNAILVKEGDLVSTPPYEIHALKILEDGNQFLVFSQGIRGGKNYEDDTYRVESIFPK